MRIKAPSVLAGAGAPLIFAGTALAGFVGIKVVTKAGAIPEGPLICNVFATFNRPGQDRFLSAGGTPESPMDIHVVGGTFYQHLFGKDTAPNTAFLNIFPSIAFDSFVTIGAKGVGPGGGQPIPPLILTPGWPGFGPGPLTGTNLGWANTPADANTDPFNPAFVNGNGQVLIGQFTTLNGIGIVGMFRVLVTSNGASTQLDVSFAHFIPGPGALGLVAIAGLRGPWRRRSGRRHATQGSAP